jgi:hypothetical protein
MANSTLINSACDCCDFPYANIVIGFGFKIKTARAKFCKTNFNFFGQSYLSMAAGTLTPSNPPNPTSGELYSSIKVNYYDDYDITGGFVDGICFDTTSSRSTYEEDSELIEIVENNKIKTNDLINDSVLEQACSSDCGSPQKPKLIGYNSIHYYSESELTTLVGGGCGADYFSYCGGCDNEDDFFCYGDGEEPIVLNNTNDEKYESSVNGCKQITGQYQVNGTYTKTQTVQPNCCFAFVCLAVVNRSPNPSSDPFLQTTVENYDVLSLPFNIENTTAEAIEPIDISDVIDAGFAKLNEIDYNTESEPIYDGYSWQITGVSSYLGNGLVLASVSHELDSSPFSESGFSNDAQITLSELEYSLRIGAPTASCYIKFWFVEEFLPQTIPIDWPKNFTGNPIPTIVNSFTIEHEFANGGEIENKCYKKNINFTEENTYSTKIENSTLITESPLTLTTPTEAGTKNLKLLKFSFLKNYTPNDPDPIYYTQGCKPNGFPDPTVECT